MPGLTTKESHPQERKFLGVLSPAVGIHPGIAPAFKVARFLWRKRQMERLHAMAETVEKGVGICLILETRHKVISKPVQIRCTPAVTPNPTLEPEIENITRLYHFCGLRHCKYASSENVLRLNLRCSSCFWPTPPHPDSGGL